jgi:ribosomal protein S18 acetylase RimI-like enzyme
MGITIREALPHELAEVGGLCRLAYQTMSSGLAPEDRETVMALVGDAETRAREGVVLVAANGDRLAGTVSYYAPETARNPRFEHDWALVRILGVHPDYREQGIAGILMDECIERARADKATAVALQTSELTPVAVAMYQRRGFRRKIEFPLYDRRYWVYVLTLV